MLPRAAVLHHGMSTCTAQQCAAVIPHHSGCSPTHATCCSSRCALTSRLSLTRLPPDAGGPASCKAGGLFVIASTAPGEQSSLASPNEAYALVLRPTGRLVIVNRATGREQVISNTLSTCVMPTRLQMLPSGQLVLRDRTGAILWSSASACRGNDTCYTYDMRNDGQLVVTDGSGAMVWSSNSSAPGSSSQPLGWLEQLTSGGSSRLSCVQSGPVPAATQLYSPSREMALRVTQASASLQLVSLPSNTLLWSPLGALPGRAPASLCVTRQGGLYMQGFGGQRLWSSDAPAFGTTMAPYNLILTEEGCLDLVDSNCKLIWTSHDEAGTKAARSPPATASRRARPPAPPLSSTATGKPPSQATLGAVGSSTGLKPLPPRRARPPMPPRPQQASLAKASPTGQSTSTRQSPPPRGASFVNVAGGVHNPQCVLTRGMLCGGISMCGSDAACGQGDCCQGSLICTRHNKYTWFCGP
jgi:hypothetical protein